MTAPASIHSTARTGRAMALLLTGLFLAGLYTVAARAHTHAGQPSAAVQEMATIMHRLKHFPSPQGRQSLQAIIDDSASSENERVLARAMMNLQHRALEDDKGRLKRLMDDPDASNHERELAAIIYHLDHRPSSADKQKLQAMMQHGL